MNLSQHDRDVAHAWRSARNLQCRDAAPGPRQLELGSGQERRVVDRRVALVGVYARLLLIYCRADPARLSAIEPTCRARSSSVHDPHGSEREGEHAPWQDTYAVGAELGAEALRIVSEAGAADDQRVRLRLLAGVEYQTNRELFGMLDDPRLVGTPHDLIAELDRIDATADEDLRT